MVINTLIFTWTILFTRSMCGLILETEDGSLFEHDGSVIRYLDNCNDIVKSHVMQLKTLPSPSSTMLATCIDMIAVNKAAYFENLCLSENGKFYLNEMGTKRFLDISLVDILEQPLLVDSNLFSASKNTIIHKNTQDNLILCLDSYSVQVMNDVYHKEFTLNFIRPLFVQRCSIKILENSIYIDEKKYDTSMLGFRIKRVFGRRNVGKMCFMALLDNSTQIIPYRPVFDMTKRTYNLLPILYVLSTSFILAIISLFDTTHSFSFDIIDKLAVNKESNYDMVLANYGTEQVVVKIYKKRDHRVFKELLFFKTVHCAAFARYFCTVMGKSSANIVLENLFSIQRPLNKKELHTVVKVLYCMHLNRISYNNLNNHNVKLTVANKIVLINFENVIFHETTNLELVKPNMHIPSLYHKLSGKKLWIHRLSEYFLPFKQPLNRTDEVGLKELEASSQESIFSANKHLPKHRPGGFDSCSTRARAETTNQEPIDLESTAQDVITVSEKTEYKSRSSYPNIDTNVDRYPIFSQVHKRHFGYNFESTENISPVASNGKSLSFIKLIYDSILGGCNTESSANHNLWFTSQAYQIICDTALDGCLFDKEVDAFFFFNSFHISNGGFHLTDHNDKNLIDIIGIQAFVSMTHLIRYLFLLGINVTLLLFIFLRTLYIFIIRTCKNRKLTFCKDQELISAVKTDLEQFVPENPSFYSNIPNIDHFGSNTNVKNTLGPLCCLERKDKAIELNKRTWRSLLNLTNTTLRKLSLNNIARMVNYQKGPCRDSLFGSSTTSDAFNCPMVRENEMRVEKSNKNSNNNTDEEFKVSKILPDDSLINYSDRENRIIKKNKIVETESEGPQVNFLVHSSESLEKNNELKHDIRFSQNVKNLNAKYSMGDIPIESDEKKSIQILKQFHNISSSQSDFSTFKLHTKNTFSKSNQKLSTDNLSKNQHQTNKTDYRKLLEFGNSKKKTNMDIFQQPDRTPEIHSNSTLLESSESYPCQEYDDFLSDNGKSHSESLNKSEDQIFTLPGSNNDLEIQNQNSTNNRTETDVITSNIYMSNKTFTTEEDFFQEMLRLKNTRDIEATDFYAKNELPPSIDQNTMRNFHTKSSSQFAENNLKNTLQDLYDKNILNTFLNVQKCTDQLLNEKASFINNKINIDNWKSSEILQYEKGIMNLSEEICYKSDVFAFGILLSQNYTNKNLFGDDNLEIEQNILRGSQKIDYLADYNLRDLMLHCTNLNYKKRPHMRLVFNHPFFWNSQKKFDFIANVSDFIEYPSNEGKKVFLRLEKNRGKAFPDRWDHLLDPVLLSDINEFKEYKYKSIRGLLRAIRNKGRHYTELSSELKSYFKSFPDGFVEYFEIRFPALIMICHYSASCCQYSESLREFYNQRIE